MMSPTEEDFELELRSLPGVLNVGTTHRDNGDVEGVTLVVLGQDASAVRVIAMQIASLYYPDATVLVENVNNVPLPSGGDVPRITLVRADFNQDDGVCEVHLSSNGRVGVGRASSGSLIGGAEATLAALRDLGYDIPFYLVEVVNVATVRGWPVIVTLRSNSNDGDRFGIAQSEGDLVAAAKATLDALNRFLSTLKGLE
jgi:hypothetical protein